VASNWRSAPAAGQETKRVLNAYLDAVRLIEPIQARLWQQARLTLTQRRLLQSLRSGQSGQGELGRELGLSPASLTRLVDRLEERGLVVRSRDSEDRRRVTVELQPAGQRLLGETRMLRGSTLSRAVEAMAPEARNRLAESLEALIEATRALEGEADEGGVEARRPDG
jgi:DNA-binding MarR family transcriptional regulator